jgi:CDGSH-type Zn-finger protein
MEEPVIAARKPASLELEPGTYYWCRCGLSKKQPFCNGSHYSTKFQPMEFHVLEKKRFSLCQCKRTKIPPHCDGTHNTLPPIE